VAAVVADSRYLAEDALALIDVDYVPLPVTVTAWGTQPEVPVHDEAPDNVLLTRTFTAGDTDDALSAADLIVERELITNRHAGNPMECRAGLALWQPERRRLTFWSGTQVPHIVRNMVAELLGLPENSVRVIAPGVRGVGEGGTLGPAAALAGAVGDALGVAVDRLPITPGGLWELMQRELMTP
jgi:aerobic carbon-monoxide dehydrogenase large subunit